MAIKIKNIVGGNLCTIDGKPLETDLKLKKKVLPFTIYFNNEILGYSGRSDLTVSYSILFSNDNINLYRLKLPMGSGGISLYKYNKNTNAFDYINNGGFNYDESWNSVNSIEIFNNTPIRLCANGELKDINGKIMNITNNCRTLAVYDDVLYTINETTKSIIKLDIDKKVSTDVCTLSISSLSQPTLLSNNEGIYLLNLTGFRTYTLYRVNISNKSVTEIKTTFFDTLYNGAYTPRINKILNGFYMSHKELCLFPERNYMQSRECLHNYKIYDKIESLYFTDKDSYYIYGTFTRDNDTFYFAQSNKEVYESV